MTCVSDEVEVFVAGAQHDEVYEPFVVRESDIDPLGLVSRDVEHRVL